jgi:alpha-tubulin suppressor-like RCC1 family protein
MKNVKAVSCYTQSLFMLHKEGTVSVFGKNVKGRCGAGEIEENILVPTPIKGIINIVKIESGYFHTLLLDSQGQAYSAGNNGAGELGRNDTSSDFKPVEQKEPFSDIACGFGFSFFISANGGLYSCGKKLLSGHSEDVRRDKKYSVPLMTPFFKDMMIKQVACGLKYVCVIISTGDVYSWGDNTFK